MQNKTILLLTIYVGAGLFFESHRLFAAYYPRPDVPDYDIVVSSCYPSPHAFYKRSHYRTKHFKRSHYSISHYYVYSTHAGDLIWVPSPCDCGGVWVRKQRPFSRQFIYDPYNEATYTQSDKSEDIDYDMDMRTSDDVDNAF